MEDFFCGNKKSSGEESGKKNYKIVTPYKTVVFALFRKPENSKGYDLAQFWQLLGQGSDHGYIKGQG